MELQEIFNYYEEQEVKYNNLKVPYQRTQDLIDRYLERVEILKAKLERQKKYAYREMDKLPSGWKDTILRPIAEELIRRLDLSDFYEVMGCFGLNNECSLWFYEKGFNKDEVKGIEMTNHIYGSLLFHPNFRGDEVGIKVWTFEDDKSYSKNSFGYLHGDHHIMTDVTSIEQLEDLLKQSINNRKQGKENF